MAFMLPKQYPMTAADVSVPDILASSKLPRPIPCSVKQVSVSSSTASQNAGGRVSWSLPGSANGFIKSNTVTVNFNLKVSGPANRDEAVCNFPLSGSATALFNRVTLSIAGKSIQREDNYHLMHNINLLHNGSIGLYDESQITERPYNTPEVALLTSTATLSTMNYFADNAAFGSGTGIDISVPLQLSLFNNGYGLPLALFAPGSVNLDIDLNTVSEAFCQGASNAVLITDYSISNCVLTYELMETPQEYMNGIRQGLSSGQNYTLPFISTRVNVTDNDQTKTHNYSVNLSSLRAVLWYSRSSKTLRSAIATGFDNVCVGGLSRGTTSSNTASPVAVGLSSARLFCDGILVNSRNLDKAPEQFLQKEACFNSLNDSDRTCAKVVNRDSYATTYYVGGINTTGSNQSGYIFTGKPCSSIQLEINRASAPDAGNLYSVVVYDQLLLINGMGEVELVQ